jgi:hypothetical protein
MIMDSKRLNAAMKSAGQLVIDSITPFKIFVILTKANVKRMRIEDGCSKQGQRPRDPTAWT